jgi:hypothetical protein
METDKDIITKYLAFRIKELEWFAANSDKITEYLKLSMVDGDYYNRLNKIREEFNKNYKEKYSQKSKENLLTYQNNLYNVIVGATTLSQFIYVILVEHIATIKSPALKELIDREDDMFSSIKLLQLLRSAEIITEEDYANLHILYKIRNKFAHITPPLLNIQEIFNMMVGIKTSDESINTMPNNVQKYYKVVLFYSERFRDIRYKYVERDKSKKETQA